MSAIAPSSMYMEKRPGGSDTTGSPKGRAAFRVTLRTNPHEDGGFLAMGPASFERHSLSMGSPACWALLRQRPGWFASRQLDHDASPLLRLVARLALMSP